MVVGDCTAGVFLLVVLTVIVTVVNGNSEGDALVALRHSLKDPNNVLDSWDSTLVNPCTWFHITCNQDSHVTRVYVTTPSSYLCVCVFDLGFWIFFI